MPDISLIGIYTSFFRKLYISISTMNKILAGKKIGLEADKNMRGRKMSIGE